MTTWWNCGGQWRRPFEDVANDRKAAAAGRVPRWTAEDEANLTRRVLARVAATQDHGGYVLVADEAPE